MLLFNVFTKRYITHILKLLSSENFSILVKICLKLYLIDAKKENIFMFQNRITINIVIKYVQKNSIIGIMNT